MPYNITPLRQLERLYGSILRAASLLVRVSESSERQEHLLRSGTGETNRAVALVRNTLAAKMDVSSAQLQQLNAKLAQLAERPLQSQPSHPEIQQHLATLQSGLASATPGNPAINGWRSYSQCDEERDHS